MNQDPKDLKYLNFKPQEENFTTCCIGYISLVATHVAFMPFRGRVSISLCVDKRQLLLHYA